MALALLQASPINVMEDGLVAERFRQRMNFKQQSISTKRHECLYNGSKLSTSTALPVHVNKPRQLHPLYCYYPTEKEFLLALELYNKEAEVCRGRAGNTSALQRWECKGEVRASLQLCVMCKDVGKVKAQREKYYIDVMEVKMYRTIFCQGCLGSVLHKNVGNCVKEIEERLQKLKSTK